MIGTLSSAAAVSSGDTVVIYSQSDSAYEGATLTLLKAYFQSNLTFAGSFVTQYSAPSATGFSVTIGSGSTVTADTHLILTPTGTLAAGTITLPPAAGCLDGQKVMINSTQIVTALTIGTNGATAVTGALTAFTANGYMTLKYDKPSLTWYRVG